ncbi:MAG: LamG-like jellyroll fold domain-containing protein [Chloroflexota bacterium]
MPTQTEIKRIDSLKTALRLSGEVPIDCGSLDADSLKDGFTMEAWVRPAAVHRGVVAYTEVGFGGESQTLKPGRYDDLDDLRIGRKTISSLQVPPGYWVVLFDGPNCQGQAKAYRHDVGSVANTKMAQSLLVIDMGQAAQEHMLIFEGTDFKGKARVLGLQEYEGEALSIQISNDGSHLSLLIPPGLEATCYDQGSFTGHALPLQGEIPEVDNKSFYQANIDFSEQWVEAGRFSYSIRKFQINSIAVTRALSPQLDQVALYPEPLFAGQPTMLKTGTYRDLSKQGIGSATLSSFRIPEGLQITLYDQRSLAGESRTFFGSQSLLGDWAARARSLVVSQAVGRGGVGPRFFATKGRKGKVWEAAVGRYDTLTNFGPFNAIQVPDPFEVILYDQPKCKGESRTLRADVDDLGEWKSRAKSLSVARRVGIFMPAEQSETVDEIGLQLELLPGRSKIAPPTIAYAGKKLRADQWHHLALTFDGTTLATYLDGKLVKEERPSEAPNLSGNWLVGQGFHGDVGLVSAWTGAKEATDLALERFDVPDEAASACQAAWVFTPEQWTFDRPSSGPIKLIKLDQPDSDLEPAYWPARKDGSALFVAANFPTSLLDSQLGHKLQTQIQKHGNALLQAAQAEGHAQIAKAHRAAQNKLQQAQAQAQAKAEASRFEAMHYVSGGQLAGVGPNGKAIGLAGFQIHNPVEHVALFDNDTHLVLVDYTIPALKVWDLETGECIRTIKMDTPKAMDCPFATYNYNGWKVVYGTDQGALTVWDLETGECIHTLRDERHVGYRVTSISITDYSGLKAVASYWRDDVRVWDLQTGKLIRQLKESPDGHTSIDVESRHIIVSDSATIQHWDLDTGNLIRIFGENDKKNNHTADVCEVAIYDGYSRAISASSDKTLKIWNMHDGTCIRTLKGHTKGVNALAVFNQNGWKAVSASSATGSEVPPVKVWNLDTGECLQTYSSLYVRIWSLVVSQNGLRVFGAHNVIYCGWSILQLDKKAGIYLSDTVVDPVYRTIYQAWQYPHGKIEAVDLMKTRTLYGGDSSTPPVHSLAVDLMSERVEKRYLYWIEGDGKIARRQLDGSGSESTLLAQAAPGRDNEWDLAIDPEHQRLFWSNGREIWSGTLTESGSLSGVQVIVPHGRSSYPIALTVDDKSGDIFWLDKEQECLRRAKSDGTGMHDLYEALDPREGLALDPELKRLFWNAEYREMVEAAVIDEPGLFCWLQDMQEPESNGQHVAALEDARIADDQWGLPGSALVAANPKVLNFDGETDGIPLGSLVIDDTSRLAIELWVYHTDVTQERILLEVGGGLNTPRILFTISGSDLVTRKIDLDGNHVIDQKASILKAKHWTHVLLFRGFDTDMIWVDVNGQGAGGIRDNNIPTDWTNCILGHCAGNEVQRFAGQVAMLRVWNRRLEWNEREAMAQHPLSTPYNESDIVLWLQHDRQSTEIPTTAWTQPSEDDDIKIPEQLQGRQALRFDGPGEYIELGPLYLDCTQGFTVEAWVQFYSLSRYGDIHIINLGNGQKDDNIILGHHGDSERCRFEIYHRGSSNHAYIGGGNIIPRKWYHVTATIDPVGHGRIYIDGKLLDQNRMRLPRSVLRTRNYVGHSTYPGAYFDGQIASLRLWNRSLSEEEIQAHYRDPLQSMADQIPNYHRSMLEYRSGKPYLMSGSMDGAEPAVPLFELAVDSGLSLQSKTAATHQRLVQAHHKQAAEQKRAAAAVAAAREAAAKQVEAAHAQNEADHAEAHAQLERNKADSDRQRQAAMRRLKAAPQKAKNRIKRAKRQAKAREANAKAEKIAAEKKAYEENAKRRKAAIKEQKDAQIAQETAVKLTAETGDMSEQIDTLLHLLETFHAATTFAEERRTRDLIEELNPQLILNYYIFFHVQYRGGEVAEIYPNFVYHELNSKFSKEAEEYERRRALHNQVKKMGKTMRATFKSFHF